MKHPIQERIHGHQRDLGDGFIVSRLLPPPQRRAIGPFVFMDHLGPLTMADDQAFDVRPHPHIGLATVTYLWQGRIEHRDGLGNQQVIEPGAVNWMTAGHGIVHSERTLDADRGQPQDMHGLQLWVALPLKLEDSEPSFHHTPASDLPVIDMPGVSGRLVAGHAWGQHSPVPVSSQLFYADLRIEQGRSVTLPNEHPQRAAYVLDGGLEVAGESLDQGDLVIFHPDSDAELVAQTDCHVVLLGGAPLDAPRYIWWNFVASSEEKLKAARQAWRDKRYPMVDGDPEFIPLPEDQRATVKVTAG